jgi:hypothetical protein
MEKVKHVIDEAIMTAGLQIVLQCRELGDAGIIERSDLAVEDRIMIGQRRAGVGDGRKPLGPIEAVAGLQCDLAAADSRLPAVAVEFDLMDPGLA